MISTFTKASSVSDISTTIDTRYSNDDDDDDSYSCWHMWHILTTIHDKCENHFAYLQLFWIIRPKGTEKKKTEIETKERKVSV